MMSQKDGPRDLLNYLAFKKEIYMIYILYDYI